MKIYDISKTISPKIAVWPEDQPFERKEFSFEAGSTKGIVSSVQMSLHTGTHVDAHKHYHPEGTTIDQHNLERYVGSCQVIDVTDSIGQSIEIKDIRVPIIEKRVLFKTMTYQDEKEWDSDFKGISSALIHDLSESGVFLIGTDAPGVDAFNSEGLMSHRACFDTDVYILEGLMLQDTTEGIYELVALPLKIEYGDGSPVRAILIQR